MRTYFTLIGLLVISVGQLIAQRSCFTPAYLQNELQKDPSLSGRIARAESFIQNHINTLEATDGARLQHAIIRIPVVVHILYHQSWQNISDERVHSEIAILNQCFRRQNADSTKTPSVFKPLAADCEIEFYLATSDPGKRSTTGILRKYTPIGEWEANDLMKFSSNTGSDAWDPNSYLNIWVCNMRRIAGYASIPGTAANKDGLVIDYTVFGTNAVPGYEMGKTAVHEVGHWLGLKHIWGDAYCGDDLVHDTPKQGNYTNGCPTGIRPSCSNGPSGDMYMNYMDYTSDQCINLFTEGQKSRMRTLFEAGGARYSLLSSKGLETPLIIEAPVPDEPPRWLHPNIYPNPANTELTLDIAYDPRWIGKTINILNVNGQLVMQVTITSKIQVINVSKLKTGLYFLSAKKEDGAFIKQKFVKVN